MRQTRPMTKFLLALWFVRWWSCEFVSEVAAASWAMVLARLAAPLSSSCVLSSACWGDRCAGISSCIECTENCGRPCGFACGAWVRPSVWSFCDTWQSHTRTVDNCRGHANALANEMSCCTLWGICGRHVCACCPFVRGIQCLASIFKKNKMSVKL